MKRLLSRLVFTSGVLLGLGAASSVMAADAASGPAKPDLTKGGQLYNNGDNARGVIACASCHGAAGNSAIPANPNLAAQSHEYLALQLKNFKPAPGAEQAVRRAADGAPSVMSAMAGPLTSDDMLNLAAYLSQQKLTEPATATNPKLVEQGQKIWRGGIPERNVPACAGCHSPNGAGIPAHYPRLGGQYPDYIATQLNYFRAGHRSNVMMNAIAGRMSDADIKAVSDYAAGLR
jgi:cytochrome c553